MESKFLRCGEVASLFGVNIRTVERWVARGSLPAVRVPGSRLLFFIREEVEKIISGKKNEGNL